MSPFYSDISPYYDSIFPYDPAVKQFVLEHWKAVSNGTYFDAGCATGSLALALSPLFSKTIGIDLDSGLIDQAQQKLKKGKGKGSVQFILENMLNLDRHLLPKSVDLATCFGNTLPHLLDRNDLDDFFKKVKTVLNPGAPFLFQIINFDRILNDAVNYLPTLDNNKVQFQRNYSPLKPDGTIVFSTQLTVKKENRVLTNEIPLRPYRQNELKMALLNSGFTQIEWYGTFSSERWSEKSFLTNGVCW